MKSSKGGCEMAIEKSDILTLVKSRLLLQDDSLDGLIGPYVDEIEQKILNYCNIDVVPDGLKFAWSGMAVDVVKAKHSTLPQVAAVIGNTAETNIGDTTVKVTVNKVQIDDIVTDYAGDLNRYRKLRW